MSQLTDRETEAAILRFLQNDTRVDNREIDVHVEEGTVYLTGRVDSAAERQAVQEDVEAARAESVVNQITLRNYVQRTDRELKEEVKHALMRDASVEIEQIRIDAKNGEVILQGRMDSYAQKHAAEDVAWWTPGVTNVVSHLEVAAADAIPEDLKD